uniref:Uncharacterized protein n=1 Tax=Cacopsylla melanoneura TaxID=428564 RepID=A0A8D8ZJX4_9HEMI
MNGSERVETVASGCGARSSQCVETVASGFGARSSQCVDAPLENPNVKLQVRQTPSVLICFNLGCAEARRSLCILRNVKEKHILKQSLFILFYFHKLTEYKSIIQYS